MCAFQTTHDLAQCQVGAASHGIVGLEHPGYGECEPWGQTEQQKGERSRHRARLHGVINHVMDQPPRTCGDGQNHQPGEVGEALLSVDRQGDQLDSEPHEQDHQGGPSR